MVRIIRFLMISVLSVFIVACQSNARKADESRSKGYAPDEFVEVNGHRFEIAGKPYYFVGVNFWYGAYLGASPEGRIRLLQELDQLKLLGVTNLRVLAGSESSELTMAVSPAMINASGDYNEELLHGLDFLLDEMAKRNMKAVLYFTNFWQWSGGRAQWVAWDRQEAPHDPDVQGDWNGFMQYAAQFYSCESCTTRLNEYIQYVIARTNTVNGKPYTDDTAIMSWQLANEPRPGSDEGGHQQYEAFAAWLADTAALIKEAAPNHLVSTGSEGAMGTSQHIEWFEQSHSDANIDYLTFHLWPKNWSWYDVSNSEATFSVALAKTKAYIHQHIEVAQRLNKPIVLEEFGLERDAGAFTPQASTRYRDEFLAFVYGLIQKQIKIGAPLVGSNVWAWGGAGRALHDDAIWQNGDPFTGDPPQEPQGLNSIFDRDVSTLKIISDHAAKLGSID